MAMEFLNKLYTKAVFTNAPELNVTAYDLGEQMIGISVEDEFVNRLPTAIGTVGSLAIICPVTVTIDILKTSSAVGEWSDRILSNAYIGGTLTVYNDVNSPYSIKDVSIGVRSLGQLNGTEPAVQFEVKGNLEVNKDALKWS